MDRVSEDIGLTARQVALDYWIVRALHSLHLRLPPAGVLNERVLRRGSKAAGSPHVGTWAFSGGNSLSMAWGVTRRFSDDIDGTLLIAAADRASSRHGRACRAVAEWAAADPAVSCDATVGGRVRATMLSVDGLDYRVKLETTTLRTGSGIVAACDVNSLLARRGDPDWVRRFPELGGFELPCVQPWWTAINKLDALHRRAAAGYLDGLRARGRDLYDLWSISTRKDQADLVRELAPAMWQTAAAAIRAPTPRPRHGYGASPAFAEGTPANEALRDGYQQALDATVWGNKPRFGTAVNAARSLDTSGRADA